MEQKNLDEKLFQLQMKMAIAKFSHKDLKPMKEEINKCRKSVNKIMSSQKGDEKNDKYKRR